MLDGGEDVIDLNNRPIPEYFKMYFMLRNRPIQLGHPHLNYLSKSRYSKSDAKLL